MHLSPTSIVKYLIVRSLDAVVIFAARVAAPLTAEEDCDPEYGHRPWAPEDPCYAPIPRPELPND